MRLRVLIFSKHENENVLQDVEYVALYSFYSMKLSCQILKLPPDGTFVHANIFIWDSIIGAWDKSHQTSLLFNWCDNDDLFNSYYCLGQIGMPDLKEHFILTTYNKNMLKKKFNYYSIKYAIFRSFNISLW